MKRLFFCFTILFVLMFSTLVFAANNFSDVIGTRYEAVVNDIASLNIINGFTDGTFKPYENVTRAQFAKMIVEMMNLKNSNSKTLNFIDVENNHWAYNYIAIAVDNGIINGYPDGSFKPENSVNFEEMMTMVVRALEIDKEVAMNYNDWPIGYMNAAQITGLLKNVEFENSNDLASRGETTIVIKNALDYIDSKNKTNDENVKENNNLNNELSFSENKLEDSTIAKIGDTEYVYKSTKDTEGIDITDYKDGVVVFYIKTKTNGEKYLTFKSGLTVDELKDIDNISSDYIEAIKGNIVKFKTKGETNINNNYKKEYRDYSFIKVEVDEDIEAEDSDFVISISNPIKSDDISIDDFEEFDRIYIDSKNEVIFIIHGLSERN